PAARTEATVGAGRVAGGVELIPEGDPDVVVATAGRKRDRSGGQVGNAEGTHIPGGTLDEGGAFAGSAKLGSIGEELDVGVTGRSVGPNPETEPARPYWLLDPVVDIGTQGTIARPAQVIGIVFLIDVEPGSPMPADIGGSTQL